MEVLMCLSKRLLQPCRSRHYTTLSRSPCLSLWPVLFSLWCIAGCVFALPRTCHAQTFNALYSFTGASDGYYPAAALVQAKDGNLYGTAHSGGANDDGTVFRITAGGTLTTLYSFTGASDGYYPAVALIQAKDGNLYGTTYWGGGFDEGT